MLYALANFFEIVFGIVIASLVLGGLVWVFAVIVFPIKLGNDR